MMMILCSKFTIIYDEFHAATRRDEAEMPFDLSAREVTQKSNTSNVNKISALYILKK